jgi:hypothetical protein
MTRSLSELNNSFPANDPNVYNDVLLYKQHGTIPNRCDTTTKIKRFKHLYDAFTIGPGNYLYYNQLQVVPRNEITQALQHLYNDDATRLNGVVSLYKFVTTQYINIRRSDVQDFLQKQSNYQLTKPSVYHTNKPIVANAVNDLWCIDLIDMNYVLQHNKNFRYILTCVDVFSRRVWLRAIKHKAEEDVMQAMQDILQESNGDPGTIL